MKTPDFPPEARTRAENARAAPPTAGRRQTRVPELSERLNPADARRGMARLAAGEPGFAFAVEAAESVARMAKPAGK